MHVRHKLVLFFWVVTMTFAILAAEPTFATTATTPRTSAEEALREGDTDRAIEILETACEATAGDPTLHVARGDAYHQKLNEVGMLAKLTWARRMRSAYQDALEADPKHVPAYWALMEYHLEAPAIAGGSRDEARRHADSIAAIDARSGHLAHARLARQEENQDAEARHLRAALELEVERETAFRLGLVEQRREGWNEAFAVFEALLENDPEDHGALYQVGRTAALSGQRLKRGEAALRAYLRVERRRNLPSEAGARMRLGQILAHAGRNDEARAELERAVALDPDLEAARNALNDLPSRRERP